MHFFLLAALLLHIPAQTNTQTRDASQRLHEASLQSAALGRTMKYRVLMPADYATSQRRYPVLYLLHGLGGDYKDWTTRTNLAEYSRTLPLIIVMPDGENSWYTNAANAPEERFEDYILTDLQADVAAKYRTINSRHGRTIAGLSMGGYGALKMALRRPGAFAVAASFSGAFSASRQQAVADHPPQEWTALRVPRGRRRSYLGLLGSQGSRVPPSLDEETFQLKSQTRALLSKRLTAKNAKSAKILETSKRTS
ncbi:MAG: alpha/beta hydrolase-fold protein [Acidobacteriota bacterium]|nr:alpha/beta hydrolase-fold protein [Acidobacteriota bacterium]